MPMQLCDDQALGQTSSLGSIDGLGDRAIQISQSLADVCAYRQDMV
ncbi:hypothetical protein [Pseudomonas chlororaphis]|nr:hypothetical protein [Pseudomonas chlororaphis]QLL15485.1 hypothetical protein H0I86_10505 [Pseudomonas chlororaphis subsp. aurantiaca]